MRTEPAAPSHGRAVERAQTPDFGRDVHCLLGLPVDAVDRQSALQRIRSAAERRSQCFLSTPNVNFLVTARADEGFRRSIVHSDLSVADGMPLVWLAKLLDIPLRERVAGATLFEGLKEEAGALSVFFFGGRNGAAERAMTRLNQAGKAVTCVGCEFPGFGSVEDMSRPQVIERINAARPDLLVVSLGARKGQAWIERNRHRLEVPVISHLGAVVDFAAGTVARAPAWMQHTGLEWLWRIKEHPELWRRYLRDGAALARLVATRVFPSLWRRAPARHAPARLEAKEASRTFFIRLEGAWRRANLAPLRECLTQASVSGKDVRLDLGRVTYMDSAALGLLMLLEGYQREQGRSFSIASLPGPVRRLFDYSCADYLYKAPRRALAPYAAVEDEELADEVR